MPQVIVQCDECGADIARDPSRVRRAQHHFCGRACKGRFGRRRVVVECAQCGKPHERKLSSMSVSRPFCSSACQNTFMVGEGHPKWTGGMVAVTCAQCGARLDRAQNEVEKKERHFCDNECRGRFLAEHQRAEHAPNWRGGHIIVVWCYECGWPFQRSRSLVGERNFCTRACYGSFCSHVRRDEKHPGWRGGTAPSYGPDWPLRQKEARERDGYACVICGKKRSNLKCEVAVHHIVPFRVSNDNDVGNLVCLCQHHHMQVEAGKIALPEAVMRQRLGCEEGALFEDVTFGTP